MRGEITFLGYRFEVTRIQDETLFTALDPDTPSDVIEALLKMAAMNQVCYLKRFRPREETEPTAGG